jgi:acetyl esterase/lipase
MKRVFIKPYKTVGDTVLNMHIVGANRPSDGPRPAIVFFFCDTWLGFEASKHYPHSMYLASRGMACFNAEVRVQPIHGTTPVECVIDGKSAVRWVRSHAGRLGVDRNRIAVAGGSAAGHVSACCSLVDGFDDPQDDNPSISSRPNAMVLFNPVLDITGLAHRTNLFGGPEVARSLSPTQQVRPGAPPALVMHGRDDDVVPAEQALRFKEAMVRAGNQCRVRLYDGQGHGFFNYFDGDNPLFVETLKETDRFLTSLGYIAGPEQVDMFEYEPECIERVWA